MARPNNNRTPKPIFDSGNAQVAKLATTLCTVALSGARECRLYRSATVRFSDPGVKKGAICAQTSRFVSS